MSIGDYARNSLVTVKSLPLARIISTETEQVVQDITVKRERASALLHKRRAEQRQVRAAEDVVVVSQFLAANSKLVVSQFLGAHSKANQKSESGVEVEDVNADEISELHGMSGPACCLALNS